MFFLHKNYFAIDISDEALIAVKLKSEGNTFSLENWNRAELPDGLVTAGRILNAEALAKEVEKLLNSAKPSAIKVKAAICHLPDEQVYFHILKLPKTLNQLQIKRIIDNEIDEFFPFSKEELYWQNRLLGVSGEEQEILVTAAPKEAVDNYLKLFKFLNVKLLALGISSESIARSLIKEYNNNEIFLLVDIGRKRSLLALFDKTGIRTSLNINLGGRTLTDTLVEKLKVSPQQAENLKSGSGFDETKEEGRIFLVLQAVLQGLINEIKKTIDFYKSQTGQEIKKIVISGEGLKLAKLDEYLFKNLSLEVKKGEPWFALPKEADSAFYAKAVGLALLGQKENLARSINFLGRSGEEKTKILEKSQSFLTKWQIKIPKRFFIYSTIIIFLVFIFFWLIFFNQLPKIDLGKEQLLSLPANQLLANVNKLTLNEGADNSSADITEEVLNGNNSASAGQPTATSSAEVEITPLTQETTKVKINKTPTGWLNVRQGPAITYSIIKKIYPGEIYYLVSTTTDWIQIDLGEELRGWIKSDYGEIIKE
ncbi:MAG: type IV pilus assembly protein PilM [bacterium]